MTHHRARAFEEAVGDALRARFAELVLVPSLRLELTAATSQTILLLTGYSQHRIPRTSRNGEEPEQVTKGLYEISRPAPVWESGWNDGVTQSCRSILPQSSVAGYSNPDNPTGYDTRSFWKRVSRLPDVDARTAGRVDCFCCVLPGG